MTHFCSGKVTHTENTVCRKARKAASDSIHAEGVRSAVQSSAPRARNLLDLRDHICVLLKTINHWSMAMPGSRNLPAGKNGLARRQTAVHLVVVLGHFWRAKYGHFSRAPKIMYLPVIFDRYSHRITRLMPGADVIGAWFECITRTTTVSVYLSPGSEDFSGQSSITAR